MGVNFGILFGFLVGGWLNEFFDWRTAFLVVGVPGIASRPIGALYLVRADQRFVRAANQRS